MTKKLFILLLSATSIFAQNKEIESVSIGKKYTIRSGILNEDRTYWVNLPASYDDPRFSKNSYPVLYVLDGKSAFSPICGVLNFMSARENVNYQLPEMIVVGVDTENRVRDFTPNASNRAADGSASKSNLMMAASGGGEQFFDFISKELIPLVEKNHRTLPYRVYVGHSLGGLTTTYTLLYHAGVFDAYLAIDPSLWWDGASMINKSPEILKQYPTQKMQRYYVSVVDSVSQRGQNFHINSIHNFGKALKDNAPANVKWKVEVIPNTDHSSIPLLTWYYGLQFLFEGYEPDIYGMMRDPDLMEKHFKHLETTLGLKMPPLEQVLEILSHYFSAPNRYPNAKKAFKVLEMGLKHFLDSPCLNENLGKAYVLNNEPQKAVAAYEKAFYLNPKDEAVKKKLEELKEK